MHIVFIESIPSRQLSLLSLTFSLIKIKILSYSYYPKKKRVASKEKYTILFFLIDRLTSSLGTLIPQQKKIQKSIIYLESSFEVTIQSRAKFYVYFYQLTI